MRGDSILCLSLLAGVVAAAPARAQREPEKPATARYGNPTSTARNLQDYVYGVIKKIDSDAMVLEKTKYGIDQTFKFDRKTKFIQDGKASSREQFKVGDKVWVAVRTDKKSGDLFVRRVLTGVGVTGAP